MQHDKSQFPKIQKAPMRQITNSSKSKLAHRLYRNSSLNHINPNMSMFSSFEPDIQPSFLNSSSNSQLVASISLKKLKKKLGNEPYLSINNGKLLINKGDSSYFTSEKSPKQSQKRLFKKLDKLAHQPMNKILPDQLIDFPIQKQVFQQTNKAYNNNLKKSNLSPKSQKIRFNEAKEDLLPEDFIQLLEEEKGITNQFCYLKKMDHPYDLKIIQFDKNLQKRADNSIIGYPSEYITISSRGVTYFSQDQSRFVTLQEWKRQANYFKKIIKLDFFKNFKVIKNFSNWKKYLRKTAMKSTVENLKEKLVYNDLYLSKSLLRIKQICYTMETDVSYCRFDDCQKVHDIKQFRAAHQVFLVNQFQRKICELEENIKEVLITNMSVSMKQFKQQNKISSSMQGKGMPLLIGDQKNLEMPYTKQATLRTQQQKFQKFIKLVDIIITHSKVNMMSESTETLVKKLEQDNYNYERQVICSNYKNTYKGKQYLECILTLDLKEQSLFLKPTREDLSMLFQDVVSRSVVRVCRYHKKISSDIDVLSIIYDSQDQFPKESESQNLKAIMTSDNRQQQMQKQIMKPITVAYNFILKYIQKFKKIAKFHFENLQKMEEIQNFQPKHYDVMGNYLQSWHKQKQQINQVANQHESALFELGLKQFKEQTQKITDTCIRKVKAIIPKIYDASANSLEKQLYLVRSQLQNKPTGIKALMEFSESVEKIDNDYRDYQDQRFQLQFLENLIVSPSNSQSGNKKAKKILHTELQGLKQDLKIAEDYIKAYNIKAQQQVKTMKNSEKLLAFYSQIKRFAQEQKTSNQMMVFLTKKRIQFTDIINEFNNIKIYEKFLNLEESDPTEMLTFEEYFNAFEKIWMTVNQFEKFFESILVKTCKSIKTAQIFTKIQQFSNTIVDLKKIVNQNKEKETRFQFTSTDLNSLDNVFDELERTLRPLVETVECLNQTIFGDKQWKQIRQVLSVRSPQILRILQTDKNERKVSVSELLNVQAEQQLPFLQIVASKAKRNQQIAKKLEIVKNYTTNIKTAPGLFRNLTQRFKTEFGAFLQDIDEKIMMANFVLEYSENQIQKVKIQKNTLQKLKQILLLWDQYQQHIEYIDPIYLYTDWKNTSQAKTYISATQQNWKKTYKSFKQLTFGKILTAQRILPSLKQSNEMLQSLYPGIKQYFNTKRQQLPRLNYLSDKQLIKLYMQPNKDFKSLNTYIQKLFPNIEQLRIKQDQVIPYEAVNTDGQVLSLKIVRIPNFEIDEILKSTDQFVKNSIKIVLKNCYLFYDSQEFNRDAWVQDNLLQVLVFVTNVYFTRIIENDYMGTQREEKKKLLYYHLSQIQYLQKLLSEKRNTQVFTKTSVLLTQAISIRDTINYLISEQIQQKQSYGWLKQIRSYYNPSPPEHAYNEYLNIPITYGNQFVCMKNNPILTTYTNERMFLQLINSIFNCNLIVMASRNIFYEISVFNAKPYQCVFVTNAHQPSYLKNVIEGTWIIGAFSDLVFPQVISEEQFKFIAELLHQVQLAVVLKEPYLRGFKNLSINKEAAIALIHPALPFCQDLKKCGFDYRVFTPQQLPWQAYISILFQIKGIDLPNLANKLAKTLNFIENTFPALKISRMQLKSLIQAIDQTETELQQQTIPKMLLKKLLKKQLKQSDKKFLYKLFNDIYSIQQSEKLLSLKSIRDINIYQQEINKITNILKQNRICILSGINNEIKHFLGYQVQKYFCQTGYCRPTLIGENMLGNLFGYYKNNRWIDGYVSKKMKQLQNKKECFILVGNCSPYIMRILEQLNSPDNNGNYINLSNSDQFRLAKNHKILFLTETPHKNPVLANTHIKVVDLDALNSKFQPDEIFYYYSYRKIFYQKNKSLAERYFVVNSQSQSPSYMESLSSLQNLFVNNIQKIGNSSLKMLGYRSDYNEINLITSRFITILNSILSSQFQKDKQPPTKDTPTKAFLTNPKIIQKLYIWSLYWSISTSLPACNIQRLNKLFDSIKIEYDKTQSLSQSKILISERNGTVHKFIKEKKIFVKANQLYYVVTPEMEAKKELVKMLVLENMPVMVIGAKFCGKTSYLEYLESVLRAEGHSILKTTLTKHTKIQNFLKLLKKSSFIQYFPSNQSQKYKVCSRTGKKLVVFVDNFNFIDASSPLVDFFNTATIYQYYFDFDLNEKVFLTDVCFVYCKNDQFEEISKQTAYTLNFFPLYVNNPELVEIMNAYIQDLSTGANISNSEQQQKKDLIVKILPSIATLHSFITNLLKLKESQSWPSPPSTQTQLSFQIPLWIGKELINSIWRKQFTTQQILCLWKYLTIKKYIHSGFATALQKQISHELVNLRTLIVKSVNETEIFLQEEQDLVKHVHTTKPTLKIFSDYSDYYCFFAYLLKSQQYKNIITYSFQTPPQLKSQALKLICQSNSINCLHYQNQQISYIKNLKSPQVVYISSPVPNSNSNENWNKKLSQILELVIEQSNSNCSSNKITFLIDFSNKQEFQDWVRFYPCLKNITHVYDIQNNLKGETQPIQFYETVAYILSNSGCEQNSYQYIQLATYVTQKMNTKISKFSDLLTKRLSFAQKAVNNLTHIQQKLQKKSKQNNDLETQLSKLNQQQIQIQQKRNTLSQKLKTKQSQQNKNSQQKQQINKNINAFDAQLRRIKNNRKEVKQMQIKLQQNFKEKQDVFLMLKKYKGECEELYRVCWKIREIQNFRILAALHVFVELFYKQKTDTLKTIITDFADRYCGQHIQKSLPQIYNTLLSTSAISNMISDECIIRWHLSNFKMIFQTSSPQYLIEKLQSSNPDSRQCSTQYEYNQNAQNRPIFVKDPQLYGLSQVTLVFAGREWKDGKIGDLEREVVIYHSSEQQVNRQSCNKMIRIICQKIQYPLTSQPKFLQQQLKKLRQQQKSIRQKLQSKLLTTQGQQFLLILPTQIKQILQSMLVIEQRINANKCKIEEINRTLFNKFSNIQNKIFSIVNYVTGLGRIFPYFLFSWGQFGGFVRDAVVVEEGERVEENNGNSNCSDENSNNNGNNNSDGSSNNSNCENIAATTIQAQTKKQFLENETIRKLQQKICCWICSNLTPVDSIVSLFIWACDKLRQNKTITRKQFTSIIELLSTPTPTSPNLQITAPEHLQQILSQIKQNKPTKLQQMLSFSQKHLGFQLQKILQSQQQWISNTCKLFNKSLSSQQQQNELKKVFVLIKYNHCNAYKIVDREIRKYLTSQQSIFYILQSDSVQHKIQVLEKSTTAMQGWIVFVCNNAYTASKASTANTNTSSKINKMIDYVSRNRLIRLVMVFDGIGQLEEIKPQLAVSQYYQICISEKMRNYSQQILRILRKYDIQNYAKDIKFKRVSNNEQDQTNPEPNKTKKYEPQNPTNQCSKLLKIISAELICRLLTNNPHLPPTRPQTNPFSQQSLPQQAIPQKINSYHYRILQTMLKKLSEISLKDIINFTTDFYFNHNKFNDRHLFKEIKRVYGKFKIPDIYDDNSVSDLYAFFNENSFAALRTKFQNEISLEEFWQRFVFGKVGAGLSVDDMFGFAQTNIPTSTTAKAMSGPKTPSSKQKLNQGLAIQKLTKIIHQVPILSKPEDKQHQKNLSVCWLQLKHQKKSSQSKYLKNLELIKTNLKILSSKRYLSFERQSQILELSNNADSVIQSFIKQYNKLISMQKIIQCKQQCISSGNLTVCLELVRRPKQFLYAYLYENQCFNKIDWTHFGLVMRCVTDKQKQILHNPIQKGQYVLLNNFKIINAKYQPHKNYIQQIGNNQSSKLSHVILYLGKIDSPLYTKKIPFKIRCQTIADVLILYKPKQISNCSQPYVTFVEKDAEKDKDKEKEENRKK